MNLKTTTSLAIESVSIDSTDKVLLCGIDPLYNISFLYKSALDSKVITKKNTFLNVMGLGCSFFYRIDQVNQNNVLRYERGIGTLEKLDNKVYLKREIPIETGADGENPQLCSSGCASFLCSDCDSIIAYSSAPTTYAECFYSDNVLISSKSPFMPHMIRVLENSLVARLGGDLQSLSFHDLCDDKNFQSDIINIIKKHNKQLSLKCSKLDVDKVSTSYVQFNSSDISKVKNNTLILDNDNSLKFFDGSNWHKIVMEPL
jgi:hypothetical protein